MDHNQGDNYVPLSVTAGGDTHSHNRIQRVAFVYTHINKLLSLYLFFVVYKCKTVNNCPVSVVTVTMSV